MSISSFVAELPKLWIVPAIDLAISIAVIVFLSKVAQWGYQRYQLSQWPIVNHASFFNASKSKEIFRQNGRKLLYDGFLKVYTALCINDQWLNLP